MKKQICVKQDGYKDCAVACVLSIIRYYGGDISKEELSYVINTTKYGTNAFDILHGLKSIGFDGYGMKYEFENIINDQMILPAIAHIKSNNMYHFVVIYKINFKRKYLLVMDPAKGLIKIKFSDFKQNYLGTILIVYPVSQIPKFKSKISFFKYVKELLLLNKSIVIKIIILSILVIIFNIINNLYFKITIDYLIINKSTRLIINTLCIFILLLLIKNIFDYARTKLIINVKETISKNIMFKTLRHLLHLPYHYFKHKTTGEIVSRINDLDNLSDLITSLFLNVFVNIFLIIISMLILFFINSTLFIITILSLLFYLLVVLIYKKRIKDKIVDIKTSYSLFNSNLNESINAYESIKNTNTQDGCNKMLEYSYIQSLKNIKKINEVSNKSNFIKNIISDFGLIITIALGSYFILTNKMTIGDLISFYTLMTFFVEPIKQLLNMYPEIEDALSTYERINELLKIKEINSFDEEQYIDGEINISNLTYSYNNIENAISNLSINIKKNDFVLLYGKSGSGKSTFIKILSKYLTNYKGNITFGGINIKDIDEYTFKKNITLVSQNEFLFNDTLENNIKMFRNISRPKYEEALRITKVDKIRDNKKFRNNFLIEENGFNISGGERQKIVLARALLNDTNYLILDEALSEIGSDEEKEIISSLQKKYYNKTIIYVSHKKEIIDLFDTKYKFGKEQNVN